MSKIYRNIVLVLSVMMFLIGVSFSHLVILLFSVMLMVAHNIWYSMEDFFKRVIFFVFNCTFFIFLVGRMAVNYIFGYKESPENIFGLNFYNVGTVTHLLISLFISLFFLFIGFYLIRKLQKNNNEYDDKKGNNFVLSIKVFSKYFFYFTFIFRLIYLIEQRLAAVGGAYYETFATFQSQMPSVFVLLSEMNDVALFAFLATRPTKKESMLPIGLYLVDAILSLLAGRRSGFMLNILILFIYFCMRSINKNNNYTGKFKKIFKKENWVGKRHIIAGVLVTPLILVLLNTIGVLRGGANDININIIDSIFEFFYAQGVSANVIGYTMVLDESIPDGKLYSIGPILQFISNYYGYFIQGIPMPSGQTVELALNGYLFSHTISYLIMPTLYLAGIGYGSSYIAELYADFGYFGIIFGSLFYGLLIGKFQSWLTSKNVFIIMITLLMVRTFLFTPRAATISFLVSTFTPSKVIGMILITLGSLVIRDFFFKLKK